jgi:pimeloyl-ACP methyl ester carboxylesterase
LRKSTHIDMEGAGHMMHWTAPDALSSHLLRFLAEPSATPGSAAS